MPPEGSPCSVVHPKGTGATPKARSTEVVNGKRSADLEPAATAGPCYWASVCLMLAPSLSHPFQLTPSCTGAPCVSQTYTYAPASVQGFSNYFWSPRPDTSPVTGVFPEMFALDLGYLLRRLGHREMRRSASGTQAKRGNFMINPLGLSPSEVRQASSSKPLLFQVPLIFTGTEPFPLSPQIPLRDACLTWHQSSGDI